MECNDFVFIGIVNIFFVLKKQRETKKKLKYIVFLLYLEMIGLILFKKTTQRSFKQTKRT